MCGLVGVMGNLTATHENIFKDLLIIDSLRGPHSTGVAVINNLGKLRLEKMATLPHYFFGAEQTKNLFMGVNRVIIGHNRFATQGAINSANAHPFAFEHIVGAHNGTLINQHLLPDSKGFEVDSQALLNAIDKHGSEEIADKIHGAFALTWYDCRDESLHLWRNVQRPLWTASTKDGAAIFWASEPEMIHLAVARSRVKVEINTPELLAVDKEHIFKVPLAAGTKVTLPEVYERKKYVPPYTTNTNRNLGRYGYQSSADDLWAQYYEDYDSDNWKNRGNKSITENPPVKKTFPLAVVGGTDHKEENPSSLLRPSNPAPELSSSLNRLVVRLRAGL